MRKGGKRLFAESVTKMADTPIYGKNRLKVFFRTMETDFHETCFVALGSRDYYSLFKDLD